jgi:hypothetical protein
VPANGGKRKIALQASCYAENVFFEMRSVHNNKKVRSTMTLPKQGYLQGKINSPFSSTFLLKGCLNNKAQYARHKVKQLYAASIFSTDEQKGARTFLPAMRVWTRKSTLPSNQRST